MHHKLCKMSNIIEIAVILYSRFTYFEHQTRVDDKLRNDMYLYIFKLMRYTTQTTRQPSNDTSSRCSSLVGIEFHLNSSPVLASFRVSTHAQRCRIARGRKFRSHTSIPCVMYASTLDGFPLMDGVHLTITR